MRSWLEDYIDLNAYSDAELVSLITSRSSEVEAAQTIDDYFEDKVVIGRIQNTVKHPQADRLKIFDVDLGSGKSVKIISAAPNVRDGLLVPVALEGCRLPFVTIVARKMRGQLSEGMCLGQSELLLQTEPSPGLWELNDILEGREYLDAEHGGQTGVEAFLGKSICLALPEFFPAQTIIDIKVLPDKIGSIGNHLGMAIELAACLDNLELLKPTARRLLEPEYNLLGQIQEFVQGQSAIRINFADETSHVNYFWLFDLRLQKTTEEPSYHLPAKLTRRMFLTQRHLVGGLVDLSNYLLADTGQPNHFFSQEKTLPAGQSSWTVDQLTEPRNFQGLGQLKNAQLPAGLNVIVDENERLLAIPGISGGEETKSDLHEKEVLFEIANFEAQEIARNSFILKYRSEGAKIWAGYVRPVQILVCLLRTIEILRDQPEVAFQLSSIFHWSKNSGNQEFTQASQNLLAQAKDRQLKVNLEFIASRLDERGLNYWRPTIEKKLQLLGQYEPTTQSLHPYPFYTILQDKYDLLLEISRLIGFDNFQEHPVNTSILTHQEPDYPALEKIRDQVRAFGFDEVITRPFVSPEQVFQPKSALKVLKAYRSQEPLVRDNLFFSLISCLAENLQRGEKEPRIFELNKTYLYSQDLKEKIYLAGLTIGADPYLLTSLGRQILTKASLEGWKVEELDWPLNQLGQGYFYNSGTLDYRLLQVNNATKKEFNLPLNKPLWYFEFNLTNWDRRLQTTPNYQDESSFPPVWRTYSLLVPQNLHWQEVYNLVKSLQTDFQIHLTPIERLPQQDQKDILNFQVKFLSYDRTLTGEEVASWQESFLAKLQNLGEVAVR